MTAINTNVSAPAVTFENVTKLPLFGPDNMPTGLYGIFRDSNGELANRSSVTGRYVPHQGDDVAAMVDGATAVMGGCDIQSLFDCGHYVNLAPTIAQRHAIYGTADNVFPRINISAGYDGKSFKATMGYYRDACQNMAMLRSVRETVVTIRHTSGLRGKMDSLIEQFQTLKESWGSLTAMIDSMESREVVLADFLNEIYGDTPTEEGSKLTRHKNRTEAIFQRIIRERSTTGRPAFNGGPVRVSYWEAFNGVQGYVQHQKSRKHNPSSLERAVAAYSDPAVLRAESLALAA